MDKKISRFLFTILLPSIVPVLLIMFFLYAYRTFLYFKDFYNPGLNSSFYGNNQLKKGDFELSINMDAKPSFEYEEQGLFLSFSSINIYLDPSINREIDQFCINELVFALETSDEVTDPYIVNPNTSCLLLDDAHKQTILTFDDTHKKGYPSGIYYQFTGSDLFEEFNAGLGTFTRNTHVIYPFDNRSYRFMAWVKYSVTYSQGETEQGIFSPFLNFGGLGNLLPNNWEVHVWGEKRLINIIDDEGKVSSVLSEDALDTKYYSIYFQRPFVIRFLYISVFVITLGFVVMLFFIKKADIYLTSVLVIIFGLISIKPLFPLPSDITNNFSLTDLLLLMIYVLVGISGINFLINDFIAKNIIQNVLPKPRRIKKKGRNL